MKENRRFVNSDMVYSKMSESKYQNFGIRQSFFLNVEKFTQDIIRDRFFINSAMPSFPGISWDRFLNGSYRVGNGFRVPLWMDLVVTGRCHCKCWHCFRSKYSKSQDLELSLIKRIINEANNLGTVVLGITGGEPMIRSDVMQIIESIPDGMEGQLYSTGYKMSKDFIKFIRETNLTRCVISLDDYRSENVKKTRGYKNAFNDSTAAISLLNEENIYTAVSLCITESLCNIDDLHKYIEFVKNLGADEIRFILPVPQGNLEGKNYKRLHLGAMKMIKEIKEEYINKLNYPNLFFFSQYERAEFFGCTAGHCYISINNDGNVTPCVCIPLTFGNIKAQSLNSIYNEMGKYYCSTGGTCFGKRLDKVMQKMELAINEKPYSLEISKKLAEKCIVNDPIGKYFEYYRDRD